MPAYIMRPGERPGVALYTRCEDELLCRAELLLLLERAKQDYAENKIIYGYYDVDPTFTIAQFKRSYQGRAADYKRLMAMREKLLQEGWPFPQFLESRPDSPPD